MEGAVSVEPSIAGETSGDGQVLWDGGTCSDVHFVRSLAVKGRVGNHSVMLLDVESDETFDGGEGVEVVEEQPVVLEGAPPSLNHRIGEGDFHLSEDAAEMSEAQEFIDVAVDILDSGIGNDGCGISTEVDSGPGSGENRTGRLGLEPGSELPREDAAGEVVDHGVQVKSSSVEQPDDGHVDVPVLVGPGCANSLLRRRGMDTSARTQPTPFSNEPTPGCGGGEECPDALGVERETAQRHVAIAAAGRKVPFRC